MVYAGLMWALLLPHVTLPPPLETHTHTHTMLDTPRNGTPRFPHGLGIGPLSVTLNVLIDTHKFDIAVHFSSMQSKPGSSVLFEIAVNVLHFCCVLGSAEPAKSQTKAGTSGKSGSNT
jgi:hypothetical protein